MCYELHLVVNSDISHAFSLSIIGTDHSTHIGQCQRECDVLILFAVRERRTLPPGVVVVVDGVRRRVATDGRAVCALAHAAQQAASTIL